VTGGRGRRRNQLLNDFKEKRRYWLLEEEHSVENPLWRRLWTCRKTAYVMNEGEDVFEKYLF
jgi:hypothetical protein